MKFGQINNIRINLDKDFKFRCRVNDRGSVRCLEEFDQLHAAQEFCRKTRDFVRAIIKKGDRVTLSQKPGIQGTVIKRWRRSGWDCEVLFDDKSTIFVSEEILTLV